MCEGNREECAMSTASHQLLVLEQHLADLRRAADDGRAMPSTSRPSRVATIQLRLCNPNEWQAVAALSLSDQRVVANPFVPTGDAVALLRLRAEHVLRARRRPRLGERLRLRFG
jgi:hypothetical protein